MCKLCGEECWNHAEEDCYMHLGNRIDRVYDQVRDEAMVMAATKDLPAAKDEDN